jgi:hypothetical protein
MPWRKMLAVADKLEASVRAALIVRDEQGRLLDPQPTDPIPVDPTSVLAEVKRLRLQFGRGIDIDSRMIVEARKHMREQEADLTA